MTVAACVVAPEPAAMVAQNLADPAVTNPIDENQTGGNAGDQSDGDAGGQDGGSDSDQDSQTDQPAATTVQLPTIATTSVSTTVSVPDGGTVLLGGLKRFSEGRHESGIPLLSKIPYVSRLFRNVAIGRDASSMMLMVTPRIIIQEEE